MVITLQNHSTELSQFNVIPVWMSRIIPPSGILPKWRCEAPTQVCSNGANTTPWVGQVVPLDRSLAKDRRWSSLSRITLTSTTVLHASTRRCRDTPLRGQRGGGGETGLPIYTLTNALQHHQQEPVETENVPLQQHTECSFLFSSARKGSCGV